MKTKINQQNLNQVRPGDSLYMYPLSGEPTEEFDEDVADYNEYTVVDINPGKYISFQQNIVANIVSGYMTIVAPPIRPVTEILNGYWWMDDK